ncbi:sensor of ECF-type sigma factor [Polaribacter porphyrae]|uniref:Sensor of ECF-type sigma factor n=1 Tax=Polaribacter porphyrae TaxID=1137780 RepID=A0A2S7WMG5_9FLAO|nr:sensor of ECF-type sigma factor [Polaribacter porphyrae]PQJ78807.1 hypothetical protein BTO18_06240 [Polaribacter porphyrae]
MKKIILLFLITFLSTISVSAQMKKGSRKKIKALKIAYLTEQLNLTSDEAEKFWPIYNDYDLKQHKLRSKTRTAMKNAIRKKGEIDAISEVDAKELISSKLDTDKKIYELQKSFINKLEKFLSYKKIIKLQVAEIEFTRKLMRKYKRKRKNDDE